MARTPGELVDINNHSFARSFTLFSTQVMSSLETMRVLRRPKIWRSEITKQKRSVWAWLAIKPSSLGAHKLEQTLASNGAQHQGTVELALVR